MVIGIYVGINCSPIIKQKLGSISNIKEIYSMYFKLNFKFIINPYKFVLICHNSNFHYNN